MNIVPKLYGGGDISSLFTTYRPVQTPQVQAPQSVKLSNSDKESLSIKSSSKDEDKEDTKGELTEKDLFNMIKDIDGLPNEMKSIITDLKRTLATKSLVGIDTGELANTYLSSLYKLKVANQNKKRFDESIKDAKENGSIGEVAITLGGNLLASDKSGKVKELTLQQYQENPDQYSLLTNSNLAWLRKYSPKYAFSKDDNAFEIINNGMGYEAFQKLLDQAKVSLGSYKYEEQGIAGKEALLGLKALQNLSKSQQQEYLQSALDGKYQTESSTDTNAQQIKALVDYLTVSLPKRAKVWASLKTGISDPNKATQALVTQYLSGSLKSTSSYKIDYLGTDEKLKKAGKSSSDGGSSEDPKEGFWRQLQSDKAGDEQSYNLLIGRGQLSVDGKYYGTTPGMDNNKSLTKYIGDSKVGYLIKNRQNITFGDQQISSDSFDDIMVNSGGGAMTVTLPITPDGKVNFSIMDTYSKVINKLKQLGAKVGTQDYERKKAEILKRVGLGYLVDASKGEVNPKYFGHFLVLEGVASSKAQGMVAGKKQKLQESQYIENASGDDALFDTVKRALSDKDKGEYELDNNWITFNNDKLYKGNIYIPINTNPLNAANADGNDIKESTAYRYEQRQQVWDKQQKQKATNTATLWQ